ncbi:hypothetical protein KC19_8G089600 [Ceratodon purpureus]|uniref:Uncharacterized protein n=1 Tax=Ceratodon purpureus TaxID=3225 RepID=A0A8T0H256_CERPU|nr:hypothetical protein KC19_8G089600 [Ceratodon purpureus]KAG0564179.1 hypothetical protein KC19_8G089600 [Ceratodon purpureus]
MYSDESGGSEEDDYSNSDGEETEVHEERVAQGIADGTLVVKNNDGTYKCPLSPGRKKQSYKYREILAHAHGVSIGKKSPEKKGGHRALLKYLQAELQDKPMIPQAPRVLYLEQAVPKREVSATKLLSPWMGILVNIDNSRTNEKGFRLAAGAADIKEKFKEYNPERMDTFHDYQGHQGTGLLTFKNDIHGLEDAQAFDQNFAAIGRGRKEWFDENRPANLDLYGWQATEEDVQANLGQLTKHLKKYCDLKTVKQIVEENERINKQVVVDLVRTVDLKNDLVAASHNQFVHLRNMVNEVDNLRMKAEEEKRLMEEKHKQDLEEMKQRAAAKEAAHHERVLAHQVALAEKLRKLEIRCEEMKEAEKRMKQENAAERRQFDIEKEDAQRLLAEANKQAELHAAMQCKQQGEQKEIIRKHEDENKELEMDVQSKKKNLMRKQQLELQNQQAKEMLEIAKSTETDKEKIADLEEEQELLQAMVNALTQKERTANDQLQEARKVAIDVLEVYGVDGVIGLKLQGSINKMPWKSACKKKFKNHPDGWELQMAKAISEWEARIGDQTYHPFLNEDLGGDTWKRVIKKNDPHLLKLKNDLGVKVMETVTTAMLEVEEFNASGRYPVLVAWDFRTDQRVLLKDLLLFLKARLDDGGKYVKAKKKRVG